MNRRLKVKAAMSVLIDKSVCPHASGQRTAMHVCDERGQGVRAAGVAVVAGEVAVVAVAIEKIKYCIILQFWKIKCRADT